MFVLASCSPDIETGIVGEWTGKIINQDIVFYEDGQVDLNDRKYGTFEGDYTITDGNTLTCTFESAIFTEPLIYTVKIKGDKLILKRPNGREEVYVRED
jgi:hypothetical protein